MLDLSHVPATPGLDVQYFQGPGWAPAPTAITVTAIATGGVLTVTAGTWQIGQAIRITGDYLPGTITGHTSGAIYYIITVTSTTSITISASPGGAAVTSSATTITAVTLATGGVLTVTTGAWQVGQPITITGTFTAGSITGYVSGTTYYIITVTSTTSITISASLGGAAVTSTAGTATPGATFTVVGSATWNLMLPQWQTWRKPRGIKWVYMLGIGGGGSGGTGVNTGTTSGSGAGGGSGSQTVVMIPAMFVPDTLYIACGNGGAAQTTSGVAGLPGTPTYVAIEPDTGMDLNKNLLWANPSNLTSTTVATTTVAGTAGTAASAATIGYMPLAGRGFYNQLAGQAGSNGAGTAGNGSAQTLPTTGLMVTGGSGGGGTSGASTGGGATISSPTGVLGTDFFASIPVLTGAVTSTPGQAGANFIARNFIMNYGGQGGGGATITAGGSAGAGGDGAPGCGGGGSGGATTTNPTLRSGAGGPGFVLIASW